MKSKLCTGFKVEALGVNECTFNVFCVKFYFLLLLLCKHLPLKPPQGPISADLHCDRANSSEKFTPSLKLGLQFFVFRQRAGGSMTQPKPNNKTQKASTHTHIRNPNKSRKKPKTKTKQQQRLN